MSLLRRMQLGHRMRARAAALLAAALTTSFGMILFACSSTTVGTGGDDTGDDGGGGGDAGRDSSTVVIHDAGSDGSAVKTVDGGGGKDSGGGGGGDAGDDDDDDDASCGPGTVPGSYAPPFIGTQALTGACMAAQVAAYVAACGDETGTVADCDEFAQLYPSCLACIETNVDAGAWGAVVIDPVSGEEFANVAGCLVAVSSAPDVKECAQSYETVRQCEIQACDTVCTGYTFSSYIDCTNAADDGTCETSNDSYNDCISADLSDDAGTLCQPANPDAGYDDTVKIVATTLCVAKTP